MLVFDKWDLERIEPRKDVYEEFMSLAPDRQRLLLEYLEAINGLDARERARVERFMAKMIREKKVPAGIKIVLAAAQGQPEAIEVMASKTE